MLSSLGVQRWSQQDCRREREEGSRPAGAPEADVVPKKTPELTGGVRTGELGVVVRKMLLWGTAPGGFCSIFSLSPN